MPRPFFHLSETKSVEISLIQKQNSNIIRNDNQVSAFVFCDCSFSVLSMYHSYDALKIHQPSASSLRDRACVRLGSFRAKFYEDCEVVISKLHADAQV